MAKITYPAIVERAAGGGLGLYFPDLPGCVSATETDSIAEAMAAAEEALTLHIAGMVDDGAPLPRPRGMHAFGPDELGGDYLTMIFVSAEAPKAAAIENVRVNVIINQALLEKIDAAVERLSTNRSHFLSHSARHMLGEMAKGDGPAPGMKPTSAQPPPAG